MTKKKVTAPLTYNPGKGRPKEHLAYLNYQEMQALKRLNGNNMERGPRGLPSFPPADAQGSSSKASSTTRTSGPSSSLNAPARTAPSSSVSRPSTTTVSRGPSSSLNAPARTTPSSSVSRPSGAGFSGVGGGGGGGARDSGQAAARQASQSRLAGTPSGGTASISRISGGVTGGNQKDSQFKQAAESRSASKAVNTPALRDDRSKTVNVGPMGTPVRVGAPSGQQQRTIPRATVTTPMATQGPSFRSPLDARISNRFAINDAKLRSGALGIEGVPSVSQIAAENARRLNTIKMAQQYAQYRSPPSVVPPAPQGVFGPRAGEGTGYLRTADMPGMITTGVPSELSGMPGPRFNAEQTLRAYEEAKRLSPKIQDRIPATTEAADGLYKRPGRDPAVERVLAEAGFDPMGRRLEPMIDPSIPGRLPLTRIPAQAVAPLRWQPGERMLLPGYREAIQDSSVLRSPIPQAQRPLPPGFGAETPATTMPSLGEAGRRLYDAFSGIGGAITGAVGAGINALADVGLRPGSVISTDEGLKIVNPDKTLSPYSAERERIIKMMSPEYQYQPPSDPALSRFPKNPPLPSMPVPTGEESVESGLPAIPMPQSTGMLAPPKPKLRPADLRRLESYPGADGITREDIGGVFEEGDADVGPKAGIGPRSFLNLYSEGLPPGYAERYGLDKDRILEIEEVPEFSPEESPVYGDFGDVQYPRKTGPQKLAEKAPYGIGLMLKGASWLDRKRWESMSEEERLSLLAEWARQNKAYARGETTPPGRSGGVMTLEGGQPRGRMTASESGASSTPSTPSGRRPDIYYMWDLGVNIPSPSDPNYTQYQTYLAERLAAQRAMGYV